MDFYDYNGDWYTESGLEHHDLRLLESGEVAHEDNCVFSEIDNEYYLKEDPELLWYQEPDGSSTCTVHNKDCITNTEDTSNRYEETSCYEYKGLYYRYEDNMLEAQVEDEKTTEVA